MEDTIRSLIYEDTGTMFKEDGVQVIDEHENLGPGVSIIRGSYSAKLKPGYKLKVLIEPTDSIPVTKSVVKRGFNRNTENHDETVDYIIPMHKYKRLDLFKNSPSETVPSIYFLTGDDTMRRTYNFKIAHITTLAIGCIFTGLILGMIATNILSDRYLNIPTTSLVIGLIVGIAGCISLAWDTIVHKEIR